MIEYSASNPAEVLSRFLCPVCREVVKIPKMTPCQHIFCQSCLKLWLENSSSCPLCRQVVYLVQIQSPPKGFTVDLSQLVVRCSFTEKGCSEEMALGVLKKHEKVCRFKGPRCSSIPCKRPLQNLDDQGEPGNKIKRFCCKGCLEEHAMIFYIQALKRMKKWKDLKAIYENCNDGEAEKDFFKQFSEALVAKLQDIEVKVTDKIRSQFSIPETEDDLNRRWNTLIKRLLDTITSHFANLLPECEMRLEAVSTEGSCVKIIKIHYTPRFTGEFDRNEPIFTDDTGVQTGHL